MARILVIAENPDARSALGDYLTSAGHQVSAAGNAEEAVSLCADCVPQIAIIDWLLPDSTGLEIAQRLKNNSPQMRVILVSGLPAHLARQESRLRTQPARLFERPYHYTDLASALQMCLDSLAQ